MSTRRMLIDAAHPEEIRVVVSNDGSIEEFEYQNAKRSIKGNIYLAKVTRVEPSLQAAFVDYGMQKQGFLPFSEIHPDYYQIPKDEKEKLMEELANARKKRSRHKEEKPSTLPEMSSEDADILNEIIMAEPEDVSKNYDEDEHDEDIQFYKRFKIQEVIKKDQVILIQIEKEERGTKGASLTSYISLAGRYCVFMPNATKGGGVSRKIENHEDRNRLKDIAHEFTDQLGGQGAVIIRTAGGYKTKTEIKRDFTYLQKLWDNIREHTLKSNAPAFIHEEGDVIKKSIRDLYDGEIEEIQVEGAKAFEDAKEFMKLILPRHVAKIKQYNGSAPLFSKFKIDTQLASLYNSQVSLKSGGYIIINHTEALVAIDVNSGKSTSERNIESTALKTNMEAAEEIARQLKLRDLSGLIVIDFIDMEEMKNRKTIERIFKQALDNDRAKIQVGRISTFGLLEMSRQRLRQSFLEANTDVCAHCNGRGRVRPIEATSISVLRAVENETANERCDEALVSGCAQLVHYMLNNKRVEIAELEKKFGGKIVLYTDESAGGDGFFIELKKNPNRPNTQPKQALSNIHIEHDAEEENSSEISEDIPQSERKAGDRPNRGRHDNRGGRFKKQHGKHHDKNRHHNNQAHSKPEASAPEVNDDIQPASINATATPASDFLDNVAADGPKQDRFGGKRRFKRLGGRENNQGRHHGGGHQQRGEFRPKNPNTPDNRQPKTQFPEESINEEKFEAEMAVRREKNQSLLKEIWKKIVD
jgi:ribonuclease E